MKCKNFQTRLDSATARRQLLERNARAFDAELVRARPAPAADPRTPPSWPEPGKFYYDAGFFFEVAPPPRRPLLSATARGNLGICTVVLLAAAVAGALTYKLLELLP